MSTQEKIRDVMLRGTEQEVLAFLAVLEEHYQRDAAAQSAREKLHCFHLASADGGEKEVRP